jgi:hypothetical protein
MFFLLILSETAKGPVTGAFFIAIYYRAMLSADGTLTLLLSA